jgi:hypothetical protein
MKPILTIAFCLLIGINAPADTARKFDEYTNLPFSDEKARLDNVAIQLQHEPSTVAWYFIFAGTESCAGEARLRAIRAKNYIVKKHGIPADRIIWVDEGYRENLLVEIWVMPRSRGKPYPTNVGLDRSEVQINKNCESNYRRRQRRIKLQGAPNNSFNRSGNDHLNAHDFFSHFCAKPA